jgi:heavy metal sensor kinase
MLRSIRWTLQLWHAAILIAAVLTIGFASFFAIRQARYQQIDSELEAAGQLIVARLHAPGPRDRPPRRDLFNRDMGGPPGQDGLDGPPFGPDDFGNGPAGQGDPLARNDRPNGLPPEPDHLPPNIDMPPGFLQRYGGSEADARSFIVFRKDNSIAKSFGALFDLKTLPTGNLRPADGSMIHREVGELHEIFFPGPVGSTVLVTGSVHDVNTQLRQLVGRLAAAVVGVLVIGLAGGAVISRFAIRPIKSMSVTAGSISVTRLSERIDDRRVPTELKELASVLNTMFERLQIAFQQQARFTADASHELRTPLAVVLSHTELALSRDRTAEEYRKTIETCHNAASRMKSLVESLLLLSHADVGELALQPVPMDLSDVVRDQVELLNMLAEKRSITLATQLQNATLVGDPMRLGQVVANLLSNAIRYNVDGGSIAVTTEIILEEAVLTVADTGAGISAEDQKHVFDRFFRADKARSRDAGGSGLGLAICKSIIEAHGGSLDVSSQVGAGTTFTVRVPRKIEDPTLMLPEKIEV